VTGRKECNDWGGDGSERGKKGSRKLEGKAVLPTPIDSMEKREKV